MQVMHRFAPMLPANQLPLRTFRNGRAPRKPQLSGMRNPLANLMHFPQPSSPSAGRNRRARLVVIMLTLLMLMVVAAFAAREPLGYLAQAARGQAALILNARPIEALVADPGTDPELRAKLETVLAIRQFAVRELGLPDDGSYRSYVDVGRPYVAWNVVATPELSVEPLEWCYPIAGCLSYRGYFNERDALEYARQLRDKGYDVHIDAVPTYSTLGWFDDPVLSTIINYSEVQLARMIFHELAHSVAWVPGDTRFNEAFAVAVEEEGVQRWLQRYGKTSDQEHYAKYADRKRSFLALLDSYQARLAASFRRDISEDEKRLDREALLEALGDDFQRIKLSWGGYSGYDQWFEKSIGNAHLAAFSTYHALVPGFAALLERSTDMRQFYNTVSSLASLPAATRDSQLLALGREDATARVVDHAKHGTPAQAGIAQTLPES